MRKGVVGDNQRGKDAYHQTPFVLGGVHLTFNLVAILIVGLITIVLVIGIRESDGFNAAMVLVKVAAVLFVIFAGLKLRGYEELGAVHALRMVWGAECGGSHFLCLHRFRLGFDPCRRSARNPQRDVPIGIICSLAVCTVLYIAVSAVITGMVPYPQIPLDAPIAGAFEHHGLKVASIIITIGALTGITSVLLVMLLSQPRSSSRHGPRRPAAGGLFRPRFIPAFDAAQGHDPHRFLCGLDLLICRPA